MADTIIHGPFIFERHILQYDATYRGMRDRWVLQPPSEIVLDVPSISVTMHEASLQEFHGRTQIWAVLIGAQARSMPECNTRDEALRAATVHIAAHYKDLARRMMTSMMNISRVAVNMEAHIKELKIHEPFEYRAG